MSKHVKGQPTALNLWVLAEHFQYGAISCAPNRIEATSVASMRRCMKAGLFTVDGTSLVLTEAGVAAIKAYRLKYVDSR